MSTPDEIDELREEILLTLHAASSRGLPVEVVSRGLSRAGYTAPESLVLTQLELLERKGKVRKISSALNPAARRWSLTDDGHRLLAEEGLA